MLNQFLKLTPLTVQGVGIRAPALQLCLHLHFFTSRFNEGDVKTLTILVTKKYFNFMLREGEELKNCAPTRLIEPDDVETRNLSNGFSGSGSYS